MKKIGIIVAGILVVVIVLSFTKDLVIKIAVEKGTQVVTGLKLSTGSFKVGLLRTMVSIGNMRLYNPKGFQDKIMLDMPEIYVDYNLPDIVGGLIHLEEMRINMKEFIVVKNEKGELNLDSLKVVQAQKQGEKPKDKAKGKAPQIQIDKLELKVGKVIYKDYSKGGKPSVQEFNVNLNERYTNIKDPYKLVSLLVVKALMNTTIARLTNFDLSGLQGTVSDTLGNAQKLAGEAAVKAQEAIKQTAAQTQTAVKETTEKTKVVVKETADAIKKTTEGLKEAFKLPFGGSKEE